jgi:hypothetical protein
LQGNEYALEGRGIILVPSHHESIYVLVHFPSLVRIEPELHHNDSPTYTTLSCQARVWERQSNTRIACLASVRHTGQVCPTTSAEQSAQTHRCPQGTSASNLPTSAALRQMQHSFSAASASTKGPTARSAPSACSASVPRLTSSISGMSSTSSGRFLRFNSRHLSAMAYSLPMRYCLCWSQHARLSRCARNVLAVSKAS